MEKHDARVKINQVGVALDAFGDFMSRFGIELYLPLSHMGSRRDLEYIIGQKWEEGGEQLKCVLSKNYLDRDNNIEYSEENVKRFLNECALQVVEEEVWKIRE